MSDDKRGLRWRQFRHRAGLWVRTCCKRDGGYLPFIVLSAGRDGSNLMVDYLNSVAGVHVQGEVLNDALPYGVPKNCSATAALQHIRRSLLDGRDAFRGLKVHFGQLRSRNMTVENLQRGVPHAKYIILYRRNMAEQFVSLRRAATTGQWLLKDPAARKDATVRVEREPLLAFYERHRQCYGALMQCPWLRDKAVIVSYEELVADPNAVFRESVCPLLGLPVVTVHTDMVKQNPHGLRDTVENYDEVADLLTGAQARHEYRI